MAHLPWSLPILLLLVLLVLTGTGSWSKGPDIPPFLKRRLPPSGRGEKLDPQGSFILSGRQGCIHARLADKHLCH